MQMVMIKRKDITLRTETLLCLFALCFFDANRMYRNKRFCFFAGWSMSHAKRVTKDNKKTPEYYVAAAIRKLRTDENSPQKNHGQTMSKMSSIYIGSEKSYGPQNTGQS